MTQGLVLEAEMSSEAPITRTSSSIAPGTRLAIIRHGEAQANANDYIGGHKSCRGLTDRGRSQAESLANRLRRTGELCGARAFYTSILPRAIETAEIIAPSLGSLVATRTCDLCERHPGEADGLSWSEYEQRYKRTSLPGDDPHLPLSPGGETWIEFLQRVEDALVQIALAHPGELTVIVAHGGVIDSSMIRFLKMPDHGAVARLHPDNTSITEWSHIGTRWRLVRYNDASHLAEPDAASLRIETPTWVNMDLKP